MVTKVHIVGKTDDTHSQPVSVLASGAINSMVQSDITHALVHEGNLFTVSGIANAVLDGGSFVLGVNVPVGGATLHIAVQGSSSGDAEGFIRENAAWTGGTPATGFNRNRASANTPVSTFAINPTINTPGDLIFSTFMPGGTKKSASGSSGESFGEWLLPAGQYVLTFTNTSGAAADMSASMLFYEEDTEA